MGETLEQGAVRSLALYGKITSVGGIVCSLLYIYLPWLRKPLVRENNILDLLTTAMYMAVFVFGLYLLKTQNHSTKKLSWIIPLLGLFGALEEVSFGQSFLYYEGPVIYGVRIDAVHDLVQVLYVIVKAEGSPAVYIMLAAGAVILVLYAMVRCRLYDYGHLVQLVNRYPALLYLVFFGGLLTLAVLLDLEIVRHHFLVFLEELFEAMASLALMFACLALKRSSDPSSLVKIY